MNRGAAVALGGIAAAEGALAWGRHRRRARVYVDAVERANEIERPLVVIGDPDSGLHTRLARAYGCGAVCVDLHGCPACPVQIQADITTTIPMLEPDSSVVFMSCVLEYVVDPLAAAREILRIAGSVENIFPVYVDPWSLTAILYPGAHQRMTTTGWRTVGGVQKTLIAAGLASVAAFALFGGRR